MKTKHGQCAAFLVFVLMSASCTKDPEYSMSKMNDINPEITLFGEGITVPAEKKMEISIGELIKGDEIAVDPSGNMYIDIPVEPAGDKIDIIQEVTLGNLLDGWSNQYSTGRGGSYLPEGKYDICGISGSTDVKFEYLLPIGVTSIKSMAVDLPLSIVISTGTNLACLNSGFTFRFPKGFTIVKNSADNWYTIGKSGDTYSLTTTSDICPSGEVTVNFKLTAIDIQDGWIKLGKISLSEKLQMSGTLALKGPGTAPEKISISMTPRQGNFKINSAQIKINRSLKVPDRTVEIKLPELVRRSDNVFKFADSGINLSLENNTPIPLSLSGSLVAEKPVGNVPSPATLRGIVLDAFSQNSVHLDENNCPGILGIINCVPEKISIKDISVNLNTNDYTTVESDKGYSYAANCGIHLPLQFNNGTKFSFNKIFSNELTFDSTASLTELGMKVELDNQLPVDIDGIIKLVIDNRIAEVKTPDGKPLHIGALSKTGVTLRVRKDDGTAFSSIGDIELDAAASVPAAGAFLNKNNKIVLDVKSISAPEGITIRLKSNK